MVASICKATDADLVIISGLKEIAKYAQSVGIDQNLLVSKDGNFVDESQNHGKIAWF